jgi:predicted transcriptional regulator
MSRNTATSPVTVRTARETIDAIDALAEAMDRSRNYVLNQALEQYVEGNAWQVARIREGIATAREGRTSPAEDAFARIAEKHGWPR